MQKRTFTFEVKNVTDIDDRFFMFEGLAATFGNVDAGNDRILKGAFKKTLQDLKKKAKPILNTEHKNIIPVLWQHDHRQPLGSFIELEERENGLYAKGIMPRDDSLVSGRVIPQMKAGSVSDMSIGYMVNEASFVDGGVRELEELTLFETSLVTIPMNDQAVVTGFKSTSPNQDLPLAERDTRWDREGALARVKEFTGSTDKPSDTYGSAFLFSDTEKKGDFDSYKLPIADVIEGKLHVIPRAIFAATVSLHGGGGYLDISREQKESVISRITNEYKRMDLQSPFENKYLLGKSEALGLTTRELERVLIANNVCSKEGATIIASKYKGVNRDDDSVTLERDAVTPGFFGDLAEELNKINKQMKEYPHV